MIFGRALVFGLALAGLGSAVCAEIYPILRCDMGQGRVLAAEIEGDMAFYLFGPEDAPDLSLQHNIAQVQGTAWPGIGRTIWEDITFFNGGYAYQVWYGIDRLIEGYPASGGVRVLKDGVELAALDCVAGSVDATGFGVSDGFAGAGYCWQHEAQRFVDGC